MVEILDRGALKQQVHTLLDGAQVPPKRMTALFLALTLALTALRSLSVGRINASIF